MILGIPFKISLLCIHMNAIELLCRHVITMASDKSRFIQLVPYPLNRFQVRTSTATHVVVIAPWTPVILRYTANTGW